MNETNFDSNLKKIMITVNGEPVGEGLVIDSVTYAPVRNGRETMDKALSQTSTPMV